LERENVLEHLASEAESLGYRIGCEGMSVPAILCNAASATGARRKRKELASLYGAYASFLTH
jgi:hypothetical protein